MSPAREEARGIRKQPTASLLEVVDNLLNKASSSGDVMVGLAGVDLLYLGSRCCVRRGPHHRGARG